MLCPDVEKAVKELRLAFSLDAVTYEEDADGGAFTRVDPVVLPSPPYNSPTWLGFHIPHTYPYADIYPIYTRVDLRQDGQRKEAMSEHENYRGARVTQLSRRTKRYDLNPDFDTAAAKLLKTIQWLRDVA
jgi:hypothetical protein